MHSLAIVYQSPKEIPMIVALLIFVSQTADAFIEVFVQWQL